MNALIVYDDFICAAKAKAMLHRVAHRADVVSRWIVKPWPVDLLTRPLTASVALIEAEDAHLVLLVLRHLPLLPARLQDWLERWAACRKIQDAALAAWDGENCGRLSSTAADELSQFAKRHGLSFVSADANLADDESAVSTGSSRERPGAPPLTRNHILGQALIQGSLNPLCARTTAKL